MLWHFSHLEVELNSFPLKYGMLPMYWIKYGGSHAGNIGQKDNRASAWHSLSLTQAVSFGTHPLGCMEARQPWRDPCEEEPGLSTPNFWLSTLPTKRHSQNPLASHMSASSKWILLPPPLHSPANAAWSRDGSSQPSSNWRFMRYI